MIQFGIGTMRMGSKYFGILQEVSIDFSFEEASLYEGGSMYPVDVRVHTGTIEGNAAFADIDVEALAALLGGTTVGSVLTINNQAQPSYYETVIQTTTDGTNFIITLKRCKASKLSLAFARTNHVIPNFDFYCYADANGIVATIDAGDAS